MYYSENRYGVENMDKISFRKLQESDIKFLSELLNNKKIIAMLHNIEQSYDNWLNDYNEYWKNDNDEIHFIIYLNEKPIGWLKLNGLEGDSIAWISMLVISPCYQNKGIGRVAVAFAEDFFKEIGFSQSGIHTTDDNINAYKLYTKCCYVVSEHTSCTTEDGVHRKSYKFIKNI